MQSSAIPLPPAGVSLPNAVWKMCQVRGFCARSLPLTRGFHPFHASAKMIIRMIFFFCIPSFSVLLKCSTFSLKLLVST